MIRLLLWIAIMIVFSLIEVSFFRSLPGFLALTPFVLAVCVYLVQHQGAHVFIWWLPIHGALLDSFYGWFSISELVAYTVGGIVVSVTAKHLFSNRSYYGVLSCALTGSVGILATQALMRSFQQLFQTPVHWLIFLQESVLRILLLVIFMTLLYPCATRIRALLNVLGLLPEPRKTY